MSNMIKNRLKGAKKQKSKITRKIRRLFQYGFRRRMPNAVTLAAMEDALHGRDVHGPFESVEALMADLNA